MSRSPLAMQMEWISITSDSSERGGRVVQDLDALLVRCGVSWLATRGLGGL